MEQWLKDFLAKLGTQGANPMPDPNRGGTPPFIDPRQAAVVGTPLHTSTPDPSQPPALQMRGVNGTPGMPPVAQPSNQVPNSPPDTVTANTAVNPFESALGTARGDYQQAIAGPAHKQDPFLQALYLGLQGVQRAADPHNPANNQPVQWLGEAKRTDRIRKAGERLAPLEAQQERILGENYKKAQTTNLYEDNDRMERERVDRSTKAANDLMERKRTNWHKRTPFFDPKKATPSQIRELAEFGETPESIGKYDLKDPKTKKIGDTEFKWDRNENAWVEDGLPKDRSEAFVEVTAKDPSSGKSYTFVTSQEKAAQLMNSRTVAGLQIEAAKDRQLNQQNFQAGENEKTRQATRDRDALKAQMNAAIKQYDTAVGAKKQADAEAAKARLLELKSQYDQIDEDN